MPRPSQWATCFATEPIATTDHVCTCGRPIGPGDQYLRHAIPPWAYEDRDPDTGEVVRFSIGEWIVVKTCYDCRGAAA